MESVFSILSGWAQAIEALDGRLWMIGMILLGLLLCGLGSRLVRPLAACCGVVMGASIGAWFAPAGPTGAAIVIGAATAGLLVSMIAGRILLALAVGMIFGILGITMAWSGYQRGWIPATTAQAEIGQEEGQDAMAHWMLLGDGIGAEALARQWTSLEPAHRTLLVASAASGFVAGFIGAMIAPVLAAITASSLLGASIVLGSLAHVVHVWMNTPGPWQGRIGPETALALLWAVLAMGGIAFQWSIQKRKADTGSGLA